MLVYMLVYTCLCLFTCHAHTCVHVSVHVSVHMSVLILHVLHNVIHDVSVYTHVCACLVCTSVYIHVQYNYGVNMVVYTWYQCLAHSCHKVIHAKVSQ